MNSPPTDEALEEDDHHLLQNYRLGRTIGCGAFAKVKLAEHVVTGAKVAVKIVNRRKMMEQSMWPRIKREISLMQLLRHPHIITLYEVLNSTNDIIMVMEYAPDELFQRILSRGAMEERQARRYFQQIISALEYCHRHKIAHRDLKPENLLLSEGGNVKIADFGLSNEMRDGDFLKTSCGSPNYAAPEVINGQPYSGPEVDVWSAGVILYVMLVGRLPFEADYIPSLFRLINSGRFDIPQSLGTEASDLIQSMLVVDTVKRATVADIQQHPWFLRDLPAYLKPLLFPQAEDQDDLQSAQKIDGTIVRQLSDRLQLDESEIWSALLHPSRSDLPLDDSNGSIQVAYRILCDQQRHSLLLLHEMNHEMKVDIGSDNAPADKTNETQDESLNISSTINNDQQQHQQFVQPVAPRWHFGIRSKSSPREILLELYKVLQRLDMSWCDPTMALRKQRSPKTPQALQSVSADYFAMTSTKEPWGGKNEKEDVNNADEIDNLNLIDPYRIRVRARNNLLVFELQLYSTGGEAAQEIGGRRRQQSTNNRSSQNSYVVDVKCCPDDSPVDPVLFLETVGQLISELINSS